MQDSETHTDTSLIRDSKVQNRIPPSASCSLLPDSKIASIKKAIKKLLPDWCVLLRGWRNAHGTFPRIIRPVTFNEKVLHRILFDRRAVLTQLADKAAVRSYVEQRIGPEILPKLYFLTSHPDTIPFDDLPDRFVVKPTHGSGWVQLVADKSTVDRAALIELCSDWLKRSYYKETREPAYKHIEPRIMVEELIDDGNGIAPNDYKLFVFDGTVRHIRVHSGRFTDHRVGLFTPTWKRVRVGAHFGHDDIVGDLPPPAHFAEMITAAETLGRDLDFVRADFYDTGERLYFGELTMTPGAGYSLLTKEFDRYLGGFWKTPRRYSFGPLSTKPQRYPS
ncbi:MAG: ATP-grasp fold amidoligase family protein [Candidatus Binataceae bacterium]